MKYVAISLVIQTHTHGTTTITLRHMRRGLMIAMAMATTQDE